MKYFSGRQDIEAHKNAHTRQFCPLNCTHCGEWEIREGLFNKFVSVLLDLCIKSCFLIIIFTLEYGNLIIFYV